MTTTTLKYLHQGAILTAAAAATHVYGLVDQAYISKIGIDLLRIHYYVDYLLLVFILFGRTIGQSLLVVLAKSSNESERERFLSGAFSSALIIGLTMSLVVSLFTVSTLETPTNIYTLIQALVGILMLGNLVLKFNLISAGRRSDLLIVELVGNIINLGLDHAAYVFFQNPSDQFFGIASATLITPRAI